MRIEVITYPTLPYNQQSNTKTRRKRHVIDTNSNRTFIATTTYYPLSFSTLQQSFLPCHMYKLRIILICLQSYKKKMTKTNVFAIIFHFSAFFIYTYASIRKKFVYKNDFCNQNARFSAFSTLRK